MTAIRLIAGLGNPGPRYEDTRHNVGFWLVDALARRWHVTLRSDSRLGAQLGRASVQGHDVWLMKPDAYMNESGGPVGRVLRYYKLPLEALLVAYDELDLPAGAVRLRERGGHGGHNGMRDVTSHVGGTGFARVRLGIGRPRDREDVVKWVLSRPSAGDRRNIEDAIDDTLAALSDFVVGERQRAIRQLHSRSEPSTSPSRGERGDDGP